MKKYLKTLSLATLNVCLTFSAAAAVGNPSTSTQTTYSDQQLGTKIQDKLKGGWISKDYPAVTATVDNGNVTLKGTVATSKDKEKIEKEIRDLDGVHSLNSQLLVQDLTATNKDTKFAQDTFKTPEDEQLNKKIRESVSKGWIWDSYKNVSLNTDNGVVTLGGSIKNLDDQNKLVNEIQKVNGVKSVKTNLSLVDTKHEFPQDSAKTAQDELLNKKIRDAVSKGWIWDSYKDVSLNTDNGVVTLGGTIQNLDDQNKLVNEIQKIDGVKSVQANLTVRK